MTSWERSARTAPPVTLCFPASCEPRVRRRQRAHCGGRGVGPLHDERPDDIMTVRGYPRLPREAAAEDRVRSPNQGGDAMPPATLIMTTEDARHPSVSTGKELLARLVAFDTTSAKTNIPFIEFVEAYLAGPGIASRRVPTADGLKSGLFASIGPEEGGGLALSGHTDVVPVAGQNWDTDPSQLVERDGKPYGRGTCDMKGYLGCCLAVVPSLKARKLKMPFHLAFSYDEEAFREADKP